MSSEKPDSLTVRRLNSKDLQSIVEVYSSQSKHMGLDSSNFPHSHIDRHLIEEYLIEGVSSKTMFGVFVEDRLVMCMGILFWTKLPSCTLLRFASLNNYFSGKDIKESFVRLNGACLDEIESRGYNKFYILSSTKHAEMLAYLGGEVDRFSNRYMMAVEEVIPANLKPRFEMFYSMMDNRTWSTDLVIRSGTLLNKFRKLHSNIISERTLNIWQKSGVD